MIKAIFYKEWIKCRALLLVLMLITIALVVYLFINNANLLRTSGAIAVWSQIAEGGLTLFSSTLTMFMPLTALCIATMQYSVEISRKRFKLTLHLPYSEEKVIGAMQTFGISMILLIYAIILIPSHLGLSVYYPTELINAMIVAILPYMLGGIACYFFVMWVIIEPIRKRRVGYLLISIISLMPFAIDGMLGATVYMIPSLLLIVVASIIVAYYSCSRFKDGAQN